MKEDNILIIILSVMTALFLFLTITTTGWIQGASLIVTIVFAFNAFLIGWLMWINRDV